MKFNELALSEDFIKNLEENNFTECTKVQEMALPAILERKSLMVQAQTGTGKTATFLIPLLEKIFSEKNQNTEDRPKRKNPLGLVVVPTRELASQIMEDAEILGAEEFNLRGAVLSGGSSIDKQLKQLKGAQFVIATPGRLLDFCNRQPNILSEIDYFVLDESDRLFDMGFYPDLKKIIGYLPPAKDRVSMLFSATLPHKVRDLAKRDFHETIEIDVPAESLAVDKIKQELIYLLHKDKTAVALGLLKQLQPHQTAVVFTNTKHHAESLSLRLAYNGINCDYINGDLPQNKRQRVIERIKDKKLSVLIATDVAARGIHIHNLDLVINYDIPDDPESYVHRIGRTGRAGQNGEAITFVCDRYAYNMEAVEKLLKHKIPQVEYNYVDILADDLSKDVPLKDLARNANKTLRSARDDSRGAGRSGGGRDGQRRQGGGSRGQSSRGRSSGSRGSNNFKSGQRSRSDGRDRDRGFSEDRKQSENRPPRNRDDRPRRDQDSSGRGDYGKQGNYSQKNTGRANKTIDSITERAISKTTNRDITSEKQNTGNKKEQKGLLTNILGKFVKGKKPKDSEKQKSEAGNFERGPKQNQDRRENNYDGRTRSAQAGDDSSSNRRRSGGQRKDNQYSDRRRQSTGSGRDQRRSRDDSNRDGDFGKDNDFSNRRTTSYKEKSQSSAGRGPRSTQRSGGSSRPKRPPQQRNHYSKPEE